MNRQGIRMATVAAGAAVLLGVTGPMASATEATHARTAAEHAAAIQLMDNTGVPQIVEQGLDQRLAALPANRTVAQVVAAMYPGDPAAQREALTHIGDIQSAGAADGAAQVSTGGNGHLMRPMSFWGDAWKYTKCVAAVGAIFIPAGKAYEAIKGLGGVVEAAKLMIKAGSIAEFKKLGGNAALEILGISTIQSNCF
ncbi:hypothetical protein [Streptomyces sp. RPT161]|uniref:hypothetical protein n=1 Tax=Streptomyces sp. RPT161 TaxID=3015993 RepID=UPI0022B88B19|nr:hypothetical protein [Streptomyces sp. RPT161]